METTTAAISSSTVPDTSITALLQLGVAAATLHLPGDDTEDSPAYKKKRFCVHLDNSEQKFLQEEIHETVLKLDKQTSRLCSLLGDKNKVLQNEIAQSNDLCFRLQKDKEKFKNLCSRLQREKESLKTKMEESALELQSIKTNHDLNKLKDLYSRLENDKKKQESLCLHLHTQNVSLQTRMENVLLELKETRDLCDHLRSRQLSSLPDFLIKTAINTGHHDDLLSFVKKIPSARFVIKDGRDGYYGTERSCDLFVNEAKHVWKRLRLQHLFRRLCWTEYHDHTHVDCRFTRFSVDLIKKGSRWHHDITLPNQRATTLTTVPGITLVVHLGEERNDLVYVDYSHDLGKRILCRPRSAYVFPGFCIRHRTIREYSLTGDSRKVTPRYSLIAYITFKKKEMKRLDKKIRDHFRYYTDDSYIYRSVNFKRKEKKTVIDYDT